MLKFLFSCSDSNISYKIKIAFSSFFLLPFIHSHSTLSSEPALVPPFNIQLLLFPNSLIRVSISYPSPALSLSATVMGCFQLGCVFFPLALWFIWVFKSSIKKCFFFIIIRESFVFYSIVCLLFSITVCLLHLF